MPELSTILIVDDNQGQCYATASILTHAGFRVIQAHTGREALRAVKQRIDLVVLDIGLPDMDGREVCRVLKTDPATAGIAILHVSAPNTSSSAQADALERGADGYLVHPVDPHVLVGTVRALLRMKRAEDQARASEQRYRAFGEELEAALTRLKFHIENSPVIVTEWDKDFVLKYWSPQAEKVFGWKAEEVVGQTAYAFGFLPPTDTAAVSDVHRRLSNGSDPFNISCNRNYDKQGNVHCCEWYNSALRDADGELVSIFAITLDVTEREHMQQELRRKEERLRLAYQAAHMWPWEISETGEVAWSRELSVESAGGDPYMRTSIEDWLQRVHPDDRARVGSILRQSLRDRVKYEAEFRLQLDNGTYGWVMSRGSVLRAGDGAFRMVGVAIDITGHKLAEEALAHSEARFRLAQEAGTVGTWDLDLRNDAMIWSDELWAIYGYAPNAFPLTGRSALQVVHPEERAEVERAFAALQQARDDVNLDFRAVWPDGSVRWLECRGKVHRDENGKPVRMFGITIDVTQRKQTEEMLRLNEKLAASSRLAASLAHEINNPLAAVTNLLFLLSRDTTLSEETSRYSAMAQSELGRVAGITRNILGLYRETPEPIKVSLSVILEDVLQLYEHKTRRMQTRIEKRYQDPGVISGYPGELRQLFSNLVVNALDALAGDGRLVLRVIRTAAGVRVVVADNGPGIDPRHRRRIFEPFFTTKGELGTGLGLWVASGIARKHGGTIRLRSNTAGQRRGTVFSVVFPNAAAGAPRAHGVAAAS